MIEIRPPTDDTLRRAASILRDGGIVGIPTETVYGLAGNAFDEEAILRIFQAKDRPAFDPLIVHVALPGMRKGEEASVTEASRAGDAAPASPDATPTAALAGIGVVAIDRMTPRAREIADRLATAFWPGPLTLVLPRGPKIPDLVTSGLDTVGVRMPAHPIAIALIHAAGTPLAAPSANRFGRISPTTAAAVADELGDRIPLVVDGGRTAIGVESTIVAIEADGNVVLLRPGGVPVEAIEGVIEGIVEEGAAGAAAGARAREPLPVEPRPAPGMLESHYAPGKPVILLPAPLARLDDDALEEALRLAVPVFPEDRREGIGLILQEGDSDAEARGVARVRKGATAVLGREPAVEARVLSPAGDDAEAARHLFSALRALDASPLAGIIVAEPATGRTGLALAINDRLRRSSAPRHLPPPATPHERSARSGPDPGAETPR